MKASRFPWTAGLLVLGGLVSGQNQCPQGDLEYTPLSPEAGVAERITLEVYSDGWGNLLETTVLRTEGSFLCDVPEENPYSDPPQYYVYAYAEGYYTEIYYCTKGERIEVDLDAVGDHPQALTGTFFAAQSFFADHPLADTVIDVYDESGRSTTVTTDKQGRFGMGDLPTGRYTFSFEYQGEPFKFVLTNTEGTDYVDTVFYEPMQAAKPVIYLYPESTMAVDVKLDFPEGGSVTESIPTYGDGWHVTVDPDGLIDGAYPYLFYEASLPPIFQTDQGWLLDGEDLDGALRNLLLDLGFVGREVDDFVDYWFPRLDGWPWYAVYPQDAEALVTLSVSPAPDHLLRASLLFRGLMDPIDIDTPSEPAPFSRDGFTVTEWGVLLLD